MKRVLAGIGILIIGLLAFTVWPTPWRTDHWSGTIVRIHRVTGRAQMLTVHGWSTLERNPFSDLAALERQQGAAPQPMDSAAMAASERAQIDSIIRSGRLRPSR